MNTDISNSAFVYCVNMLRLLLKMQLITLLFSFRDVDIDVGKLAVWRLRTHDAFGKSFACKTRQVN